MNKDDTGDKNAGTVTMNEIHKRTENELDEKGTDEMEMVHDSECVGSSESMQDCSSHETELACESQGEGQEEIRKIETSADISKDEFDSVSDLIIDETGENEAEEGKNMKRVSFDLDCQDGSKGDCNDVDVSQETCGMDFMKKSEEMQETVTLTECTTESNDNNLDDDEEEEEGEEGDYEEEEDDESYPPHSQNIHRPRYVKHEESNSSDLGGDIEQKWAKLPHGKSC